MLNEKNIQQAVDSRLSGLSASEVRRMRIRAAVSKERREETPVRSKKTMIIAIALAAMLLTSAIAVAETLNLFDFFGKQDARYAALAPKASLEITEPALIEHPHLGSVEAKIDSAYFDGLGLSIAYSISNARYAEEYTPTAEEIAQMQPDAIELLEIGGALPELLEGMTAEELSMSLYFSTSDLPANTSVPTEEKAEMTQEQTQALLEPILEGDPSAAVALAYNAAVMNGTPFGYREYAVYESDHTYTDDGIDILPQSAWSEYEGTTRCEVMDFSVPLADELRSRDSLTVSKALYQSVRTVWFDGEKCWSSSEREKIGVMTAVIPKAKDAVKTFAGTGDINGVECTFTVEVSPLAAVVTLESAAPFDTFLHSGAPDGTEEFDIWGDMALVDQAGREYRPQTGFRLQGRYDAEQMRYVDEAITTATIVFDGIGELPTGLTAYAMAGWEGAYAPDLSTLDGVALSEK